MTGAVIPSIAVLICLCHLVTCYQINLLDYAIETEDEENAEGIPSSDYCSDNYPYTYSKCLRLCSDDLNVTCLDDQLCYCNMKQMELDAQIKGSIAQRSNLNTYLGTKLKVPCEFSDFCEDLCKYDERLSGVIAGLRGSGSVNATGALCKLSEEDEEIESCVCGL